MAHLRRILMATKCDGNHALIVPCSDPGCWQDERPTPDTQLFPALTEMRAWAGEQRPDVRERVWTLCDALEDCAKAALEARLAVSEALRLVTDLREEIARLTALLGKEAF